MNRQGDNLWNTWLPFTNWVSSQWRETDMFRPTYITVIYLFIRLFYEVVSAAEFRQHRNDAV